MFRSPRRRPPKPTTVEYCDTCGEACTAACRAIAHADRMRTAALQYQRHI